MRCRLHSWLVPFAGCVQPLPVFGKGCLDVAEPHAELLGFHHQVFEFRPQKAGAFAGRGGRQRGDNGAEARVNFQKPLVYQLGNHLVGGVGVDLEFLAQSRTRGRARQAASARRPPPSWRRRPPARKARCRAGKKVGTQSRVYYYDLVRLDVRRKMKNGSIWRFDILRPLSTGGISFEVLPRRARFLM